jgi:hypothetical protein
MRTSRQPTASKTPSWARTGSRSCSVMGRCRTRPRGRGRTTRGLAGSGFPGGPLAIVFDECYGRVLDAKTRRDALDEAIAERAASQPYVNVVGRLVCLRGVSERRRLRICRSATPSPVKVHGPFFSELRYGRAGLRLSASFPLRLCWGLQLELGGFAAT